MIGPWRDETEIVQALLTWGAIAVRFWHPRLESGVKSGKLEKFTTNNSLPAYRLTEAGRELARKHRIIRGVKAV